MAAVATQYAQWLNGSAAPAAGAAANANATAAIFEAARAATTHPAAVSANRSQLLSLVRSNLFGFNAPAIAAAEGAYESMWAQNVAALAGYHGAASAVAAQLAPWQQLPSAQATPATSFNPGFNPQTAAKVATKVQSDVGAFGMYADSQVTIIKGATATVINAPPAQIPQRVVQAVRVDFGAVVDIATHAAALPATVASDTISVLAGTDSPVSPPSSTPPP
ncbi:hypothetical protein A9X00_24285 [Mycobacterium sp. 1245805.9]|nr:hypothetical protein A9X00_24285 [Mycobacterium sp. 1245805.9]